MHKKQLLIVLLLTLSACQGIEKENLFHSRFPDIPMNSEIQFWNPTEDFIVGDSISLELENKSSHKIVFSLKEDVTILTFKEKRWTDINNSAIYFPPDVDSQISPKSPDTPGIISIGVTPQIQAINEPITIRVVVVGFLHKNGNKTNEKTGAFIDVTLKP